MKTQTILGLDPGSRVIGFGCVRLSENRDVVHQQHGSIDLGDQSLYQRLGRLSEVLLKLLPQTQPDWVMVEKVFVGKSVDSAFRLGLARGVCLAECSKMQIQFKECAPKSMKKSITGNGAATKEQVAFVLKNLLGLKEITGSADASDGLALAYYGATQLKIESLKLAQRAL